MLKLCDFSNAKIHGASVHSRNTFKNDICHMGVTMLELITAQKHSKIYQIVQRSSNQVEILFIRCLDKCVMSNKKCEK